MEERLMDSGELSRRFDLGRVDQISFAVSDMDASLPVFRALFGEFTLRRAMLTPDNATYRGRPASATLLLAFGRSGDVEIELIEVEEGMAPPLEHIQRHGEGMHHVRFRVADHDAKNAELEAAGFTTILRGRTATGSFSYLEAPDALGHSVVELIEFARD
jgi:catechol 2,3-dioxygenase-like lactoylglutathione lyase family enzyme